MIKAAVSAVFALVAACFLGGCGAPPPPAANPVGQTPAPDKTTKTESAPVVVEVARPEALAQASLSGLSAHPLPGPIDIIAARNEWASAVLLLNPGQGPAVLELGSLKAGEQTIDANIYKAYQVVPVPVDVNRAGFVRHTGLPAAVESLPRALLSVPIENGRIDLARLRDPRTPADPKSSGLASGQPLIIWLDLRIPTTAKTGAYRSVLSLTDPTPLPVQSGQPVARPPMATVQLNVAVNDFVLSDDRHLAMVGQVPWDTLVRHWPERFEFVRPNLINRKDPKTADAVRTIDELVKVAQAHRVQVHVPRLQPTVKWPSGQPPQIDWSDFDAMLTPWMNGQAFDDQVPLTYWPLPKIDFLDNFPIAPRLEYYAASASHFDQLDWLRRAPVRMTKNTPGRATLDERLSVSAEAQRIIAAHPRVRVQVPLEPDELQLADDRNKNLIDPRATGRINASAPGLISSSPLRNWPQGLDRPETYLRTDLSGLIPYAGAGGDQGDVRVWAWMAFLRNARVIEWDNCLPSTPNLTEPADPNELIWFYPGSWFGTDEIVPTVQLKWLRRAQEDYEYLYLARERESMLNVLPMARVLSKPVEIQPNQSPDSTYSLLIGTADPIAWRDAHALLSKIILIRGPGIEVNENKLADLNLQTLHWIEPLEKPVILPRTTDWSVGTAPQGEIGPWVNLRIGMDIYNASDTNLDQNQLRFTRPLLGWQVQPAPVDVPKLTVYQVHRQYTNARLNPLRTPAAEHKPVQLGFRSGFTGRETPVELVAPVTRSYRQSKAIRINGSLDEWPAFDQIQEGPLAKMMTRPAVQQHALESASTPTKIYSNWNETSFCLGFRVEGLSKGRNVLAARNFVDYQFGRAWGEDLCQVVVQAVYEDQSTGPLIHIALKPGGNVWVERKLDPKEHVDPWENFNPAVRYASTLDQTVWRGELAIPWSSLIREDQTAIYARQGKPNIPFMLKFNFIQHKRDTGESASWAGPLDIGRDDSFTGVIVLKEPQ